MIQLDAVQRNFYRLQFTVAFLRKHGVEFQDWFSRLASLALSPDFEAVRPYGPKGDFKCDGYSPKTRTVFQCYAPDTMKDRTLVNKIKVDLRGAWTHWGSSMKKWVFVHNDRRGLPALAVQELDQLRQEYPKIVIETWSESQLLALMECLQLHQLESLFGSAPSFRDTESLGIEDLKSVIDNLEWSDPVPNRGHISFPSKSKIKRNRLSEDAAELLQLGRRKEPLVAKCFKKDPRPDFGEKIAEAFRNHYLELRNRGLPPDEILQQLQIQAVGDRTVTPKRLGAVLAVLSYFFERCDIFEDPREVS